MEKQIENRFTYHKPVEGQAERYDTVREKAKEYAYKLAELCPESRELSHALNKLDEVVFWSNAAIARNTELQSERITTQGEINFYTTSETVRFNDVMKELARAADLVDATKPVDRTLTRKETVERAKGEVKSLSKRKDGKMYGVPDPYEPEVPFYCHVEFEVNRDKSTVVALMKGIGSKKVRARGISKADPRDVFNEHIGKAIALYRSLGRDVPDYLIYAPNPKGIEKGDVVACSTSANVKPYVVSEVVEGRAEDFDGTFLEIHEACVIDDSGRDSHKQPETVETSPDTKSRKAVVEMAKQDVEDRFFIGAGKKVITGLHGDNKVHFNVSRNNGTVEAILTLAHVPESPAEFRGFSLHPGGSVFNEHVGKAIALRKALGEEIPLEYRVLPDPGVVEVGDIIEHPVRFPSAKVDAVRPEGYGLADEGLTCVNTVTGKNYWTFIEDVTIIDDSEREA